MGYSSPYSFSSSSVSSSSSLSPSSSSGSLVTADIEAGFSGHSAMGERMTESYHYRQGILGSRASSRAPSKASKARLFFCDGFEDDEPHYFLDSCFLCKKPLAGNSDIFMYRGDTPFCSEECRQEQIEIDEARETNLKLSLKSSSRKEAQQPQHGGAPSSPPKSQNRYRVRAGTVVAV